jgi:hypothetical protein
VVEAGRDIEASTPKLAQCEARCQKKWVLRYWFRVKWRIHSHL